MAGLIIAERADTELYMYMAERAACREIGQQHKLVLLNTGGPKAFVATRDGCLQLACLCQAAMPGTGSFLLTVWHFLQS